MGDAGQRFAGDRLFDTADFVNDLAFADHRHPAIGLALALAHSNLDRLGRHRLVRKNTDVHPAFAVQVVVGGHAAGFDLAGRDPAGAQHLQAVVAEDDAIGALGLAADPAALARTLEALTPLHEAGRLGPLLAQFPASFQRTPETLDYLAWLTDALKGQAVAVELRHRSWSDARRETLHLLDDTGSAWVLIDEPKFSSSIWQSPGVVLEELRARPFAYVRLHGRNAAQWWDHEVAEDRYNYLYTADELSPFAEAAEKASRQVKKAYLYANNHFSAKSVANAVILKRKLGEPIRGDYPPALVDRYPELQGVAPTSGLPL